MTDWDWICFWLYAFAMAIGEDKIQGLGKS